MKISNKIIKLMIFEGGLGGGGGYFLPSSVPQGGMSIFYNPPVNHVQRA